MKAPRGKIIRKLLYSLIPIQIASYMGVYIGILLDNIIVGAFIDSSAIAIIGFASPLVLIFNMISDTIATGSQVLGGSYLGQGDTDNVSRVYSSTFFLSTLIGIIGTVMCIIFAQPLSVVLGATGEMAAQTAEYLRGICIGLIFWMAYKAILSSMQIENCAKVSLVTTIAMIVLKIILDVLFVAGFGMGIFGIGLASSIAYVVAFALGLIWYISYRPFRLSIRFVRWTTMKRVLYKGIPHAVQEGCAAVRTWFMNRFAVYFGGNDAVAIYSFASTVVELWFSGISGVGLAADVLNSIFAGTKDRESVKQVNRFAWRSGYTINLVTLAIVVLFARPMAMLSGAEGAQLNEMALVIRLLYLAGLFNVWPSLHLHTYRTLGYLKRVDIISVLQYIALPLLCCVTLPFAFGTTGLWLNYVVADLLCVIVLLIWDVKQLGFFPKKWSQVIYIPRSFGTPEEDQWDGVVRTENDIEPLVENAKQFCISKGSTVERSEACGDCLARLLSNFVSYSNGTACDVRVVCDGETEFLVLRDNGKSFDPTSIEPGNGLRVVRNRAKSMRYQTTLGLNVLTVEL